MSGKPIDFSGMTVNEQLSVARLLDAFYETKSTGDADEIKQIAAKVGLIMDDDRIIWDKPENDQT